MLEIIENPAFSNAQRSEEMEKFFLREGEIAGVIQGVSARVPTNPNRVGKHLAPWFGEECREAKKGFRNTCREQGRDSLAAREAYRVFFKACRKAKSGFARTLPEMLKFTPAAFWKLF